MRRYPQYKESGVEWIAKIPKHWEMINTKYLFRLVTEPAPKNNNYELLSIYTDIGVKPRKELAERGNRATTTDGYWLVKKGDFIVNKLLAWMGAIGLSNHEGVTSPAYDILRKIRPLNERFYEYLFRCGLYFIEFKKWSRGIMEVRLRLYFDQFGQIPLVFPPVEEQDNIVDFLDRKTEQIDELIRIKEQRIELLQEQRTVLINQAVTKGLDPNVEMKPSGVEWIGDIPTHWEAKRLRHVSTIFKGGTPKRNVDRYFQGNLPWARPVDITALQGALYIHDTEIHISEEALGNSGARLLPPGTVLLTSRATIGETAITTVPMATNQGFANFVCNEVLLNIYLAYYLRAIKDLLISLGSGTTFLEVTKGTLVGIGIPLPPLSEQKQIVNFLSRKTGQIDELITIEGRKIELLREYRQSLISEVVTGKIDVRIDTPDESSEV